MVGAVVSEPECKNLPGTAWNDGGDEREYDQTKPTGRVFSPEMFSHLEHGQAMKASKPRNT